MPPYAEQQWGIFCDIIYLRSAIYFMNIHHNQSYTNHMYYLKIGDMIIKKRNVPIGSDVAAGTSECANYSSQSKASMPPL